MENSCVDEIIISYLKQFDSLKIINEYANNKSQENSFYVCDVDDIIGKYKFWISKLERVKPYYAVKCNTHPIVLKVLAALGTGFDCASKSEINAILSIGVGPDRIIFANPTKIKSHLQYAKTVHVDLLTFDNEMELYKIKEIHPTAKAVIRIKYDSNDSYCVLGLKFGCDPITEAPELLKIARNLNINVVGVSFHVGSGCKSPYVYYKAIEAARHVFNVASELNFKFNLLDIGGGYPGNDKMNLVDYATYINRGLNNFFPDKNVSIISEPGTYFVDSAFTLACKIHSMKYFYDKESVETSEGNPRYIYYLNDGVFGSLSDVISYKGIRNPVALKQSKDQQLFLSTVFGPTCDSIDKIADNVLLPKLIIDDWLVFKKIGAYSLVVATNFNGFDLPEVYSYISSENWSTLKTNLLKVNINDKLNGKFDNMANGKEA